MFCFNTVPSKLLFFQYPDKQMTLTAANVTFIVLVFAHFLFLLVLAVCCGLCLWRSLDLSIIFCEGADNRRFKWDCVHRSFAMFHDRDQNTQKVFILDFNLKKKKKT